MKKKFVVLSILYILTSCSHDVIVDMSPKRPICFEASVETKGAMMTTDRLEKFYATAYSLSIDSPSSTDLSDLDLFFKNVEFEKNGNAFYSYPVYYWPDVRSIIFILWSPSLDEIGMTYCMESTIDNNGNKNFCFFKNLTPKSDITEQLDILLTLGVGKDGYSGTDPDLNYDSILGVQEENTYVQFEHALSSIEVKAKGNENYSFKVKGIRIANVYGTANYYLSGGWNDFSNMTLYETIYETAIRFSNEEVSVMPSETDFAFLLPQTLSAWVPADPESKGAYIAVLLHVTDQNGNVVYPASGGENDYKWAASPISGEWKSATTYTYTLDFSAGSFGYEAPQE